MTPETLYIGIDCGLDGAFAAVNGDGRLVEMCDAPTLEVTIAKKVRRRYAVALMGKMVSELVARSRIALVVVEDLNAMPPKRAGGAGGTCPVCHRAFDEARMGATSLMAMGKGQGLWVGLAGAFALPVREVQAATWKPKMLPGMGRDKETARLRAMTLFPDRAEMFKLKKHHNRAEAALIAEYARVFVAGGPSAITA